ncbi:nuclear transport factor 2 family protein [Streptomyces sp. NPDC087437]|uniref:nuclear transport factor 2 family protein n=1 Tax=Streptomyces sp. NPDC087437 TaxID=3365789 RepID=UPI0037F986DE
MPNTTSANLSPRDVLARYHRAMLDKSADDLADLYAADAVHEFPFLGFPGMPERYQGREEVRAGYRAARGASPAQPQKIHDVLVHESIDPEVITVEQGVVGTVRRPRGWDVPHGRLARPPSGRRTSVERPVFNSSRIEAIASQVLLHLLTMLVRTFSFTP